MSKYDIRFCKCGTIHAIPEEKIDNALDANKNLLFICAKCGNATLIGADITKDWFEPEKTCYNMYSFDFSRYESKNINLSDFESTKDQKGINEIYYSYGYSVMMKSGQNATDFFCNKFSDRWYPDFYKIQRKNITVEEIMKFIEKYQHDRTTVNMKYFINNTPKDVLEEISHYYIEGLDWTGTEYERK